MQKARLQSTASMELVKVFNTCLAVRGLGLLTDRPLLHGTHVNIPTLAQDRSQDYRVGKLLRMLMFLDIDVEILIRPAAVKGRIHGSAA
ncbi:MAG: hypothetical protein ABR905_17610 [Terracidiphilus sp.]|jgi:hypothetical protein